MRSFDKKTKAEAQEIAILVIDVLVEVGDVKAESS